MKLRLAKKLFKQRGNLRRTTRDKMIDRLWKHVKKGVFKHAMTLPFAPMTLPFAPIPILATTDYDPVQLALRYMRADTRCIKIINIPIV